MSRGGDITFEWGGAERRFMIGIGELARIQEACEASPVEVLKRLQSASPRVMEPSIVLRQGLIGGGMEPERAGKLVKDFCLTPAIAAWADSFVPAALVLAAGIYGVADEEPGKGAGEAVTATPLPD